MVIDTTNIEKKPSWYEQKVLITNENIFDINDLIKQQDNIEQ